MAHYCSPVHFLSSGMDQRFIPGPTLLLTVHSQEEAKLGIHRNRETVENGV